MSSAQVPGDAEAIRRTSSMSQVSESSHTAQEYIASQLSLEADAREALPYQFDTCTKPLGPLRQSVYACLTCTPPPASPYQQFTPAGVCYSCSISCHGEHNLVELFSKRNFVCDCGTTRMTNSGTACSLRIKAETTTKGDVLGEEPSHGNKYNQNFQGKFCGCGEEYDPEKEKGTMFQCLGLGHIEDGSCGEDWWHPECLMGLPRMKAVTAVEATSGNNGHLETVAEENEDRKEQSAVQGEHGHKTTEDDTPPGFPREDDFEHVICYKCADANPWIKQYAGEDAATLESGAEQMLEASTSRKRKAEDEPEASQESNKKVRPDTTSSESAPKSTVTNGTPNARHETLPTAPSGRVSIFAKENFRDHLCRCAECFPRLAPHPQLLEEEDTYEPPVSESDEQENETRSLAGRSVNSGSILDRGEAALSSIDRVRAIEGVMAYNHVRDKVKSFLQPFAESGQPVGAEDIKAYFAKLRGDEEAMRNAAVGAGAANGAVQGDGRKEQDGY